MGYDNGDDGETSRDRTVGTSRSAACGPALRVDGNP